MVWFWGPKQINKRLCFPSLHTANAFVQSENDKWFGFEGRNKPTKGFVFQAYIQQMRSLSLNTTNGLMQSSDPTANAWTDGGISSNIMPEGLCNLKKKKRWRRRRNSMVYAVKLSLYYYHKMTERNIPIPNLKNATKILIKNLLSCTTLSMSNPTKEIDQRLFQRRLTFKRQCEINRQFHGLSISSDLINSGILIL